MFNLPFESLIFLELVLVELRIFFIDYLDLKIFYYGFKYWLVTPAIDSVDRLIESLDSYGELGIEFFRIVICFLVTFGYG